MLVGVLAGGVPDSERVQEAVGVVVPTMEAGTVAVAVEVGKAPPEMELVGNDAGEPLTIPAPVSEAVADDDGAGEPAVVGETPSALELVLEAVGK